MKIARRIGKICTAITAAAALAMMLIVIADVLMRLVFDEPIVGATEITRMAMICMTPCFAAAALEGRHIQIGLIVDRFGRVGQLITDTVLLLATTGVSALITWQSFLAMDYAIKHNEFYNVLRWPKWPMILIFSVAMALMTFASAFAIAVRYADRNFYSKKAAGEGKETGDES